jgi:mannose-6-phosphate isomerase
LIEQFPQDILGRQVAVRFDNRLPYLFKVLAAARPLSIQVHPDRRQAQAGFERENNLHIDIRAPHRNYRDRNHKPECLCALSPFWALCGFRKIEDMLDRLGRACPETLVEALDRLRRNPTDHGLRRFFTHLMQLPSDRKRSVIQEALRNADAPSNRENTVFKWVRRLYSTCCTPGERQMPTDVGILSPCYLNLVQLQPGQALFLNAGLLHAYLSGTGMELMANSDNVIRGGLTRKHVSIEELLRVLNFSPHDPPLLDAPEPKSVEWVYRTTAEEFQLSVIQPSGNRPFYSSVGRSVEILFCQHGTAVLGARDRSNGELSITSGDSVLVPAAAGAYRIDGDARIFRASVPLPGTEGGGAAR